jgi:hypothetical protein
MLGIYIFGVIIILGTALVVFFKVRWSRADHQESKDYQDAIDKVNKEEKERGKH